MNLNEFTAAYYRWETHRQKLWDSEKDGGPAPGTWHDSDNTGVDLLRVAVELLDLPPKPITELVARTEAATDPRTVVRLTLLTLATMTRDDYPDATFLEFGVSDQDTYDSLFLIAACTDDETQIPGSNERFWSSEVDFDWHLDGGNVADWLPYMTPDPDEGRFHRGRYLLVIDKVLAEITEDNS